MNKKLKIRVLLRMLNSAIATADLPLYAEMKY